MYYYVHHVSFMPPLATKQKAVKQIKIEPGLLRIFLLLGTTMPCWNINVPAPEVTCFGSASDFPRPPNAC